MMSITKSADGLSPVAKTAASGKARVRVSMIFTGGPSGPAARSSGRSTTRRSGRRTPPSWRASATRRNSPTSTVVGVSPSSRRTGESTPPTKIVRSATFICDARSLSGHVALPERLPHDLADAGDSRHQGEVLLLVGQELHEATGVGAVSGSIGLDQLGGHHEQELGLVVLEAGASEQGAQDRDVAEHGNLGDGLSDLVVDQARDGER